MKNLLHVLIAGALCGAAACGTAKADLSPTRLNPASTGKLTAKEGPNGNTELAVRVDHLPPPAALDPSLNTFVVWARPAQGGDFVNLGQLRIDEDREGRLETLTPYRDLEVLVTGESTPLAAAPGPYVVLRGDVQRR